MALGRVERDGHVLLESLALFIRYELMVQAPLAEGDDVARAVGRDRFDAFIARVGEALASGQRTTASPVPKPIERRPCGTRCPQTAPARCSAPRWAQPYPRPFPTPPQPNSLSTPHASPRPPRLA